MTSEQKVKQVYKDAVLHGFVDRFGFRWFVYDSAAGKKIIGIGESRRKSRAWANAARLIVKSNLAQP